MRDVAKRPSSRDAILKSPEKCEREPRPTEETTHNESGYHGDLKTVSVP